MTTIDFSDRKGSQAGLGRWVTIMLSAVVLAALLFPHERIVKSEPIAPSPAISCRPATTVDALHRCFAR